MRSAQNSAETAGSGSRGRPLPKGQSGNPGGRPRGCGTLSWEETRDGAELVKFVLAVFRDKRKADLKLRLAALPWLADRGWGRPSQAPEVTGTRHIELRGDGNDAES
jgi:hypothetical protein